MARILTEQHKQGSSNQKYRKKVALSDFPYTIAKITQIDKDKFSVILSRYEYGSSYQAEKAARKDKKDQFSEDVYEFSAEEFKKLNIKYVKHPK